jgi:hypothetical protein
MPYNPAVPRHRSARIALIMIVVVYLTAAGWFFVLAPWSGFWTSRVVPNAPLWLALVLESPGLRGALSGLGVLHFAAAWSWLEAAAGRTS